jgi:cellulose synthase operon protein C
VKENRMRKLNTKFFVFLLIIIAVLSGAIFGLHQLQAGNIAQALLWQASQAEKDGKPDRAAKYLGRYLEFARDDLDQREHLGMILSEPQMATTPQRRARARFVIEQVLTKDPDRHVLRQRLCQLMITGRSFEIAKEHLTYLEKHQPDLAETPYLTACWHEAQGQSALAIDALRRCIKLDAGKVEAHIRLVALLRQADFGKDPQHADEIDELVAAALKSAPQDAGVLSLAAQHAQEKGDKGNALKYLEDGLQLHPAEPRLYLALARIHGQNGKRAEAIDRLKLGVQKVRKDQQYDLRWTLGTLLLDDNRLDEAEKAIHELRELNTTSADYLQARLQMLRGRWFDAAREFEKLRPALKAMPELAFQIDLFLGQCYEQMDEPTLQLAAFERASATDPTSLIARRGLANARWATGQTAEALQIYQELVSRTKDPADAARRRAEYVRMLLRNGQAPGAKELKKIAEELDEIEKADSKSIDVPLLRAELFFVQGDLKQAESLLQETVKSQPDRHEPWLALMEIAAKKKDAPLVGQLMQSAEKRFADKADFRLAQIHFWSQHEDAETAAALKGLEDGIAKFTPNEQSALWQALAEAHYNAQRWRDSARTLERVMRLPMHAQDVRTRMQMLELALLQDNDVQARAVLADIKRLEGGGAGGIDWSFGEAMRLIHHARKGQRDFLEQARQLLTVAAAQRPNWHPIVQLRAEIDEMQGRPDQAIANYRRAIELGSRDPAATKQLLVLLSQAQRFDEVEQVLAQIHKQNGVTEELARLYIVHSCNRRDFRKAEQLVKQIVASKSTNYRDHLWMGQILSINSQAPAEAEKALRRAVELGREQPDAWIGLVRHLISVGQIAQAKSEIESAAKALPADRKDVTLAQCYELLGCIKEAADHHQAAVEKHPESATVQRAAADFCVRIHRFAAAEALYRKMVEKQIPVTAEDVTAARRGLAMALVKQDHRLKSVEALQLVGLTLDDRGLLPDGKIADSPDEQLLQAKVLGSLNHHKLRGQAIQIMESLQPRNVLSSDDRFFLARRLVEQKSDTANWPKARALLKALTLEQPKNPRYLGYAAREHIQQKEFTDAEQFIARLEAVERERKVAAGGFGSIELRAKLLETRGLGAQATILLSEYAKQPEALPVRKLLVAHMHGRLGNFQEAIDLCEEVRKTDSHRIEADSAAVAIIHANKPSEAQPTKFAQWQKERVRLETSLRAALQKEPKDIPLRMQLAELMEMQGKYDEVEKLCRAALKDDAGNLVACNNLAWLLAHRPDQAAEALTLVNSAIERFGLRPELLDTRAVALVNLGNLEPALRDLERVVNESPTPMRLFHLSRAHERSHNANLALAYLRQANEMGLTPQQLHPAEQAEYQRVTADLIKRQ